VTAPFVIYALPRSRTYWLSRFLTYGEWTCGHDEIRHLRSLHDARAWFEQTHVGTIETAAAPFWRSLREYAPEARIAVVRRPVEDVLESLSGIGLQFDPAFMRSHLTRLDRKLDQIEARVPECLSLTFNELQTVAGCVKIFEHCLPYRFDSGWWSHLAPINLQINFAAMLRYYRAYQPQLEKLALTAKQRTLAAMVRKPIEIDGVTIQTEPFDTFFQDGHGLFAEHLVQVGEAPDAFAEKNIELMQVLDRLGCMHVVTARSNGRMFGYLMSILSPSLEKRDLMTAVQTAFYASPDFRGLGPKMQCWSIDDLRNRGVGEIYMRAGTRGSGPRMGSLYRRMGATNTGELFMIDLKAA
jgi:hypothetical protein